MYSGPPFTPQYSSPSIDLAEATRPGRIAIGALSNTSPNMWFNLAAFQTVPDSAFRFGNSRKNILDGPAPLTST